MQRDGHHIGEVRGVILPGVVASIGPARDFVRRSLDAGNGSAVEPARIDDIVLVASELVTNAVEHGTGDDVEIVVGVSDGRIELSVVGPADSLPRPTGELPPVDALRGRGLLIVAALSDDVAFERAGDSNRVTCVFTTG